MRMGGPTERNRRSVKKPLITGGNTPPTRATTKMLTTGGNTPTRKATMLRTGGNTPPVRAGNTGVVPPQMRKASRVLDKLGRLGRGKTKGR